jgi:hypothetical protein
MWKVGMEHFCKECQKAHDGSANKTQIEETFHNEDAHNSVWRKNRG